MIYILVLSYYKPPFTELMQAQQETWDSIEVPGIETIYYHGGEEYEVRQIHFWSHQIQYKCSDDYFQMQWKFKLCLDSILSKMQPCDMVFRTNSSSYIHKQRLKEWLATLPREQCYAGWSLDWCVSGAGMALSYDTCHILRREINPGVQVEEDVLIGTIMKRFGIKIIDDKSRYDFEDSAAFWRTPIDRFHYRFKTPDRLRDAENMKGLHEILIK